MFVKPAPGLRVRDPYRPATLLPETGREVSDYDIEWARLLRDGDVVLSEAPAKE